MSEAFLSRWSRLKRAPDEQGKAESEHSDPEATASDQAKSTAQSQLMSHSQSVEQVPSEVDLSSNAEMDSGSTEDQAITEPALLTDEDMPDLESINARSDVSMFFSSSVSPELRSKALKKLFHQPEFNVRDPLDEYADDYSNMPLLDRKVAATLKGWVGQQVREALQAEENAAVEKADSLAQQCEQQSDQQREHQAVDQSVADDAVQQRQPVEWDQIQCDQSPEPEYPNEEEGDQTK
ncbi:DUF3306 domain-containing protein [Nitrincola alkalilacustris]|uniref:DUF3306 domain-containing protein n=1 Tax=Nitrincola alkalilacustris TaxID=1571224 RepID=UPI00124D0F30|nr:DUF3306 domain-containing protein [Nitrincola alkalilacustris]